MSPRLLLVSPRPPRRDGQGDQRRAHEIVAALVPDWEVDMISWLPDVDGERPSPFRHPATLARALGLSLVKPCQVAYMQALMPRAVRHALASSDHDVTLFVTNRAAPRRPRERAVVDFVDALGTAARRRAEASRGLVAYFWRLESWRTRRLDRRLAERVSLSVAATTADASAISPRTLVIPLSFGTKPMGDAGAKIVFVGNLFYAPNHEAAMWICDSLVPYLGSLGVGPGNVVIAGRRPRPALAESAARAGVELRPDVADLGEVLREAAVVVAPLSLGSGMQYKIIDAVGAGRPCVVTPVANTGLALVDGRSALIRVREPAPFGDAVVQLLGDTAMGRELAGAARAQLASFMPDGVAAAWRSALAPGGAGPAPGPRSSPPGPATDAPPNASGAPSGALGLGPVHG